MRKLIPVWCALGLLLWPGVAGATSGMRLSPAREGSLPELAQASGRIFVGTVRRIGYQRDRRSGLVYTHITFGGSSLLKGRRPPLRGGAGQGAPIVLRVAGGLDEGDTWVQVAGIPRFQVGERYLVFQKVGPWTFCPLAGWDQGCYHLARRSGAGGWVALDAVDTPILGVRGGRIVRPRSADASGGRGPEESRGPMSMFGAAVPGARPGWAAGLDAARLRELASDPEPASRAEAAPPAITRYVGKAALGARRSALGGNAERTASRLIPISSGRAPGAERRAPRAERAMSAAAFLAEVRRAVAATGSQRLGTIEEMPSPLRTRAARASGY